MSWSKLGELLVKEGVLKPEQLEKAIKEHRSSGQLFGVVLTQMGFVREAQIAKALETFYQIPVIDLNSWAIPQDTLKLVPREVCEKYCVIPVSKQGNTLVVAFGDPSNLAVKDDLSFVSRCKVQVVAAPESAILSAIERYYGGRISTKKLKESDVNDADRILEQADNKEEAPVIKYVNEIFQDAINKKASDIHFEIYENKFRVRFRIDGNLFEASLPPSTSAGAIINRIKILSQLDIAEKRKPQDGRLKLASSKGKDIDFRVSTVPTLFGEKVVLRLLDKSNLQLDMTKLGFEHEDLKIFLEAIHQPQGLVLITGPTGSGKTTTIYSALADLNQVDVNISTAEDPIEFNLEGINQVQMNPDVDLTFATALKAFLRQDPDIIMVGEIRDYETAEIAFKAASTGHLVVSTLHTNDAPATIIRLTEMGVAPYLITSTITLIVAQRLVGRNCDNCKAPIQVNPQVLVDLGVDPNEVSSYKLMRGKGCNSCNGSGIRGRIAIFELMKFTPKLREAVLRGASTAELSRLAREEGMRTLRRSALIKLKRGETTIEEVANSSVKDV